MKFKTIIIVLFTIFVNLSVYAAEKLITEDLSEQRVKTDQEAQAFAHRVLEAVEFASKESKRTEDNRENNEEDLSLRRNKRKSSQSEDTQIVTTKKARSSTSAKTLIATHAVQGADCSDDISFNEELKGLKETQDFTKERRNLIDRFTYNLFSSLRKLLAIDDESPSSQLEIEEELNKLENILSTRFASLNRKEPKIGKTIEDYLNEMKEKGKSFYDRVDKLIKTAKEQYPKRKNKIIPLALTTQSAAFTNEESKEKKEAGEIELKKTNRKEVAKKLKNIKEKNMRTIISSLNKLQNLDDKFAIDDAKIKEELNKIRIAIKGDVYLGKKEHGNKWMKNIKVCIEQLKGKSFYEEVVKIIEDAKNEKQKKMRLNLKFFESNLQTTSVTNETTNSSSGNNTTSPASISLVTQSANSVENLAYANTSPYSSYYNSYYYPSTMNYPYYSSAQSFNADNSGNTSSTSASLVTQMVQDINLLNNLPAISIASSIMDNSLTATALSTISLEQINSQSFESQISTPALANSLTNIQGTVSLQSSDVESKKTKETNETELSKKVSKGEAAKKLKSIKEENTRYVYLSLRKLLDIDENSPENKFIIEREIGIIESFLNEGLVYWGTKDRYSNLKFEGFIKAMKNKSKSFGPRIETIINIATKMHENTTRRVATLIVASNQIKNK